MQSKTKETVFYIENAPDYEVDYFDVKAANDELAEARISIKTSWKRYENALKHAQIINNQYIRQLGKDC